MTDINHLPNGYELPENRMTREEWKHYFECREKYDVKYSDDEVRIFLRQMDESAHRNDTETFFKLDKKIPLDPIYALDLKHTQGLIALKCANLSDAKEVYPDEF